MAMILKTVGPGHGAYWVRDGLRLYVKKPLAFTSLFVLFLFAALFSALIPLLGGLLQMMLVPLLSLGFMVASQSALLEGPVRPGQFIEPLRGAARQRRDLLLLCLLYGLLMAGAMLLADVVADGGFTRAMRLMRQSPVPQDEINALLTERGMVAGTLVGTAAMALVSALFWHAPALVHWGHQGIGQALFSSTLAVWRCRGAFAVYVLTWTSLMLGTWLLGMLLVELGAAALAQLVAVPLGLFLSTLFYVSLIFTFNDSFGSQ